MQNLSLKCELSKYKVAEIFYFDTDSDRTNIWISRNDPVTFVRVEERMLAQKQGRWQKGGDEASRMDLIKLDAVRMFDPLHDHDLVLCRVSIYNRRVGMLGWETLLISGWAR
jgi:hypothetical protein